MRTVVVDTDVASAILRAQVPEAVRPALRDEALSGHPLYHRGLDYYGVFEVLEPLVEEQLASMNIAAGFEPGGWGDTRPFVVTFHDSTFECLAGDLHGETTERPRRDLVQRLAGQPLRGTRDPT